eukprot:TRINITY_DN37240_c0_g1_i1.p1 TRINITY_DN37240_c0_g1~~TRINITY_DN37240_c0_g1_i1.p1  ORF type:complete len:448 (+),score=56.49 TRINITY_DN37240_c0_g1_i1:3-1346(+)
MRMARVALVFGMLGVLGVLRGIPMTAHAACAHPQDLPATYDFRDYYPCGGEVIDQGQCGSCYAVAAAASLSDRFCKGGWDVHLSPQRTTLCSPTMCDGAELWRGFYTLNQRGSAQCTSGCTSGCMPYTIGWCQEGNSWYCSLPACPSTCSSGATAGMFYAESCAQIAQSYDSTCTSMEKIMREVYNNGPIVAGIEVYSNFLSFFQNYPRATYTSNRGAMFLGRHAIRIVGWGHDGTFPYWIIANSVGRSFADNGFFRYLRGFNLGGIEQPTNSFAGTPWWGKRRTDRPPTSMDESELPTGPELFVGEWVESVATSDEVITAFADKILRDDETEGHPRTLERVVKARTRVVGGIECGLEFLAKDEHGHIVDIKADVLMHADGSMETVDKKEDPWVESIWGIVVVWSAVGVCLLAMLVVVAAIIIRRRRQRVFAPLAAADVLDVALQQK